MTTNNQENVMKLFTVDQSLLQKIVAAIMEHTQCEKQEVFALNLAVKSFVPIINLDLGEKEFNLTSPSGFSYVESKNNSKIHFLFKQENDTFKVVPLNEVKRLELQFAQFEGVKQLESGISTENLQLMQKFILTLKNWTNLDIQEAFLKSQESINEMLSDLDKNEPNLNSFSNEETEKFRGLRKVHQNPVFKKFLINTLAAEGYPISEDFFHVHSFTPIKNNETETIIGYFHIIDNVNQYLVKKTEEGLLVSGIHDVKNEINKNTLTVNTPYQEILHQLANNYEQVQSQFDLILNQDQKDRNAFIWSKLKSSKMIAKAVVNSDVSTSNTAFYLAKNNNTQELKGFIQENGAAEGKVEPVKFEHFNNVLKILAQQGNKSAIAMTKLIAANGEKSLLENKIQSFRNTTTSHEENNTTSLDSKNKI